MSAEKDSKSDLHGAFQALFEAVRDDPNLKDLPQIARGLILNQIKDVSRAVQVAEGYLEEKRRKATWPAGKTPKGTA